MLLRDEFFFNCMAHSDKKDYLQEFKQSVMKPPKK